MTLNLLAQAIKASLHPAALFLTAPGGLQSNEHGCLPAEALGE